MVYPVTISADGWKPQSGSYSASSESDFKHLLSELFNSARVTSVLQSLLALSNDPATENPE